MPSVLQILCWSIVGLQWVFHRILIRIVAIVTLLPVDITGSQVKPLEFNCGPSLPAGGGDAISLVNFITVVVVIVVAPWHPKMRFVIHTFVVYRDIWVSASNLRLHKRHLGCPIDYRKSMVNTHCFRADNLGRRWVRRLLDLTPDCSKSACVRRLLGALRLCVPGIHQECIHVSNARRGWNLATHCRAAGCVLTSIGLVVEVVWAIRSVRFQLWLGSFRRNTFVLLPLQESMAQRGAGNHHQSQGYMTVLVVNRGIMKSISILTAVIRRMIKFDVDEPRYCFCQEVKWMLAIRWQLSTLSAFDLDRVHHLPHALPQEKDTYSLPEGNQWIPNALRWIQSGGDHIARLYCPLLIEWSRI